MKKNYFYGAALMLTLMGTACNNEDLSQKSPNMLQVSVVNQTPETRAIITGEYLSSDDVIGVTLVNEAGGKYDGNDNYSNMEYTTTNGTTWGVAEGTAPLLSSTTGKAIAYYPYGETVDYNAIEITTDDQTDNLYSGWVTGINNSAPNANFVMKHAKSAIRVILKKAANYSATAIATSITAESAHFVESATLDATAEAGSNLSDWSTGAGNVAATINQTLDTSNDNYTDLMVVPAESAGQNVTFTVAVKDKADGTPKNYSVSSAFTTHMAQGKCYQFTLTLTATGFVVNSVEVTEWVPVPDAGTGELKPAE